MSSMDYYGDVDQLPASFGNASLILQQHRLRDREADLKERIKAAREKAAPQGQMVSGYYVPPSKAQMLTPLVEQLTQALEKKGLDADQTGYDKYEMQAVARHLAMKPPDDAPQPTKLAWAQQGAQIPALRSLMMDYQKDQLVNEPERVAVRTDKKEAQAAALAAKKEALQATLEDRQQAREDQAARQREHDETLRAMKSMGGGGGGDRASNYQIVQDAQGNAYRVNKLTGEVSPLGAIGRETASLTADRTKQGENKSNAAKALEDLNEAETLLKTATGSKGGALRDAIAGAAGISTDGAKAAAALETVANGIVANIPRMAGQVSDADLAFLKKQGGDLANKELPTETRLAALKQVRRIMSRAANGSAPAQTPAGLSIRDAVEAAIDRQSAPAPKMRVYNPATGRLE
jgi:hypothetical protein